MNAWFRRMLTHRRHRRLQKRPARRRLLCETLEDRRLLAVFRVNSVGDAPDSGAVHETCDTALNPFVTPPVPESGECTLRAAIFSANATPGADTIIFDIPAGSIINSAGDLITGDPVTINGPDGRITVRANADGIGHLGLGMAGPNGNSTIRNLVVTGFQTGIHIASDNNKVEGNYVGISADGTTAAPNAAGITISGKNNTIGGSAAGQRNVISGNTDGVLLTATQQFQTSSNRVQGNYIGTNAAGTAAVPNTVSGVRIAFSKDNVIGGTEAEGNLISGNGHGILIQGTTSTNNLVSGNKIGTNVDGTAAIGNKEAIFIDNAPNNKIGGKPPGSTLVVGNLISGSTGDPVTGIFGMGVLIANTGATGNVVQGNRIGTNAAGTAALKNKSDGVGIIEASGNTIGGTTTPARNLISGNDGDGVFIGSTVSTRPANHNEVFNNYIGTDITGELPLPNKFRGVHIDTFAQHNKVGSDSQAGRNVISGNMSDGVIIALAGAENNIVQGNFIGTDKDGQQALPNQGAGVHIFQASKNIIGQDGDTAFSRNVISKNMHGILIQGDSANSRPADENVIEGNLIGTTADGKGKLGNTQNGIWIKDAKKNVVGSATPSAPTNSHFRGNVISDNKVGVKIEAPGASGNMLAGNLIGTSNTGKDPLGNHGNGVYILNAPQNVIGVLDATPPAVGNVIAANTHGVAIEGQSASGNQLGGNKIGVNIDGQMEGTLTNIFANSLNGVDIVGAVNNFVGGPLAGGNGQQAQSTNLAQNQIIGNKFYGVQVRGNTARGNRILRNSIHSNGLLGIELHGNGVTDNDLGDGDDGANDRQNFPGLNGTTATGAIRGTLNSKPQKTYRIDVYANDVVDPSDHGEGQVWMGSTSVTTDETGNINFEVPVGYDEFDPPVVTATATDPDGNTSEFSPPLLLPDLLIEPLFMSVSNIDRDGRDFKILVDATITNRGPGLAQNARVQFTGNGDQLGLDDLVTLAPGQSIQLQREWTFTDALFELSVPGIAVLDLRVEVDPNDVIEELTNLNNSNTASLSIDARPKINNVRPAYKEGYFLAGLTVNNRIDVFVDWNGELPNALAGLDEQPQLYYEINGLQQTVVPVSTLDNPASFTLDLGNDLTLGNNKLKLRAETNLHPFFSHFEQLLYDQGDPAPYMPSQLIDITAEPPSAQYDKVAVYKTGIVFPNAGVEAFFDLPVDRVGLMAGLFGPFVPQATLRAMIRSDRVSSIEGELKYQAKIGDKNAGELGGSAIAKLKGEYKFDSQIIKLKKLEGTVRGDFFVTTPAVPLPPLGQMIRAQAKVGAGIDAMVKAVEKKNAAGVEILQFDETVLGIDALVEGVLSAGVDKIFEIEAGLGGKPRGEFLLGNEDCRLKRFGVELFARIRAGFYIFEYEKTFRFPLFIDGCGGAGNSEGEFIETGPGQLLLRPNYASGVVAEAAANGPPVIDYPHAQLALAQSPTGNVTLVYVEEDGTLPAGQQLELLSAAYDGQNWTPTQQLTSDTLLDGEPSVAYDAQRPIAVWARFKNPIANPATVDPATLLGDMEIVYATQNAATGAWNAPFPLTSNATMDFLPQVKRNAAGQIMALWAHDPDNDSPLFFDDPQLLGADYHYAMWDGTQWTAPSTVATNLGTNEKPQFAYHDDKALFVWSEDANRSLTSDTDRSLRFSQWDATSGNWSAPANLAGADDGIADVAPRVVYDSSGKAMVTWVRGAVSTGPEAFETVDQLFFVQQQGGGFTVPQLALEHSSIVDPQLVVDPKNDDVYVVWQGRGEQNIDLFHARFERATGAWTEPVALTDSASVESSFVPFLNADGTLELFFVERDTEAEPALPPGGQGGASGEPGDITVPRLVRARLGMAATDVGADLTVVDFGPLDLPVPGETVAVRAQIRNAGTAAASPVRVTLLDDGTPVDTITLPDPLAAGDNASVLLQWPVPANPQSAHQLTVRVDPLDDVAETDENNNQLSRDLLKPDLQTAFVRALRQPDGSIVVDTAVVNHGPSTVNGPIEVALRLNDAKTGTTVATAQVAGPIAAGQTVPVTLQVPDAVNALNMKSHRGVVVVDAANSVDESNEENNAGIAQLTPFTSWTNPINRLDVDNQNGVQPFDALHIITEIILRGSRQLSRPATPPFFLDVSGDDLVTPFDALPIVQFIARKPGGAPEGEQASYSAAVDTVFTLPSPWPSDERRSTNAWEAPTAMTDDMEDPDVALDPPSVTAASLPTPAVRRFASSFTAAHDDAWDDLLTSLAEQTIRQR